MTQFKYFNKQFVEAGSISFPLEFNKENISTGVVHQVVKSTLAGKRQGTACTKTKANVSGGGKKPFKQKGTGRARQGSSRSILHVGGGTAHGPLPRDYTQKINKTMQLKAIWSVIADKLQSGKLTIVEEFPWGAKTKDAFKALDGRKLLPALVVGSDKSEKELRAVKNLQHATCVSSEGFSVYLAVKYENLIIEKSAFEKLLSRLNAFTDKENTPKAKVTKVSNVRK